MLHIVFLFLKRNVYCGYSLEVPQRGGHSLNVISLSFSKGSKRKVFASVGSEFFAIGLKARFQKGLLMQESKPDHRSYLLCQKFQKAYQLYHLPLILTTLREMVIRPRQVTLTWEYVEVF